MKRMLATILLALALNAEPALAWDPFWDDFDPGPIDPPDPAPFVIPEGLYLVTDVYAGDVVTTTGDTTTYSTTTIQDTPGTYARVVDVVGTGAGSAYDGASFNGRAATTDGRSVAGTYYEDFVLTSSGFISVNIVFFEDDSETRRAAAPTPAPIPVSTPAPVGPSAPAATPAPAPTAGPAVPVATPTPIVVDRETPAPAPAPRIGTAGIALGSVAPVLGQIEVLRGRRVTLWPRAFVDGVAVPVGSWRLVSGTVTGTCAGSGTTPSCDASWPTLAPAGSLWRLRFEITTPALPGQLLVALLDVVVRSPALEQ